VDEVVKKLQVYSKNNKWLDLVLII
jgi:hypothetical protein